VGYVNVLDVSGSSDTNDRYSGVTDRTPSTFTGASLTEKPKRTSPDTSEVWRVRGWNGDAICHSRIYQRRHAAIRNYRLAQFYYDRVTIERAAIGDFTEVEVQPWQ